MALTDDSLSSRSMSLLLGELSRDIVRKRIPPWNKLRDQILDLLERPNELRRIFQSVPWFCSSAIFTGVTANVGGYLVASLSNPSEDVFIGIFNVIADALLNPCRDSSGMLSHVCKWSDTEFSTPQCGKRWDALILSFKSLLQEYPTCSVPLIRTLKFDILLNGRFVCALPAMYHLFQLISTTPSNVSQEFVVLVVRSIILQEWDDSAATSFQDEILCRFFQLLHDIPFKSNNLSEVLTCIKDTLVRNPHGDGAVYISQLACLVSSEFALDLCIDLYDKLPVTDQVDILPFYQSKPFMFLTGFCAHTDFVKDETVLDLIGYLLARDDLDPTSIYFAVLYISIHRELLIPSEVIVKNPIALSKLPPKLVEESLRLCCHLTTLETARIMQDIGFESNIPPPEWFSTIPFASSLPHLRTLESIGYHRIARHSILLKPWISGPRLAKFPVNQHLHPDTLRHVFSFLSCKRLCRLSSVCIAFHYAIKDNWLWQQLYLRSKLWSKPICQHPDEYIHDWKELYQLKYIKTREIRRKLSWRICDHCNCNEILKTEFQYKKHLLKHNLKIQRKRSCPTKLNETSKKNVIFN